MWHTYSTNLEKHTHTCICACVVAYNDTLFSCRIQIDHIRPPCTCRSWAFTIYQSKVRQLPTAIGGQQKSTKHTEGSKEAQTSRGGDQGDTNTQQQTQQQQGPTWGGWRNRGWHKVLGVSLPKKLVLHQTWSWNHLGLFDLTEGHVIAVVISWVSAGSWNWQLWGNRLRHIIYSTSYWGL